MARETFICYKYSEATDLRDEIIKKLGEDASYYQGETAESPDLTDTSTDNIKNNLKDMIWGTSVSIIIISPNLKQSKWVDWEIEYSLKKIKRGEITSGTNGVVGVIMKVNGSYDWLVNVTKNADGCSTRYINSEKLYDIINANRYNLNIDEKYACNTCKTFNQLNGSYISLIDEDDFLNEPQKYIENAFDKSKVLSNYTISKQI